MSATSQTDETVFQVNGKFAGKKPGKTAKDLSGVAAMPPRADGSRVCLFVNDESRHAQFAVLKDGTITPGSIIPLVGDQPSAFVLGMPPKVDCPKGAGVFGEFDGEGVAYQEPYFYVAGSHGCGRVSQAFLLSAFMLARIKVDADGRPIGASGESLPEERWNEAVELTYRLCDMLQRAGPVAGFFGKGLDEQSQGLNIEGLAIDGARLLAGLRAPSIGGNAFIVAADIDSLFAPGREPAKLAPEVITLHLGKEMGIRDLGRLPDGRLVVLAGPSQKQPHPYRIFVADLRAGGAPLDIGELAPVAGEDGEPAKAEALMVLGAEGGELRVLVLFDGVKNGGPIERRFPLPEPNRER